MVVATRPLVVRPTAQTSPPICELGHLRCCTTCGATFRTDFERCPLDGGAVICADADPLVGSTVGDHYEIEALIGVGAMGRVYRAHHTRLVNKRYALKVLFGELTASPTMRLRFAHEAESASRLDHPNIVGMLDFGCTPAGLMYLVMDLVEGPTLGGLIEQGPIEPRRVVTLARQLCSGLAHAHARGIVHRDFKPDNILVAGEPGDEILRIADFGLAISISDSDHDARLTASGVLCTPTYAAPEQLLGKDIDHRADLYALGVTMYEMLTGGVLPFARGSQEVLLWKITTEWPAVSSRKPKVPAPLAQLVRRLLMREPVARPVSASEIIEELDRIAARDDRLSPKRTTSRQGKTALVAGVSATVAAGVLLVTRIVGDDSHAPTATDIATPTSDLETVMPEPVANLVEPTVPPPVLQASGPRIVALEVAGALEPFVIRRGLERAMPALEACADKVGARVVAVSFALGGMRRPIDVRASGAGATCVTAALAAVRMDAAPDVGDVNVDVRLSFRSD